MQQNGQSWSRDLKIIIVMCHSMVIKPIILTDKIVTLIRDIWFNLDPNHLVLIMAVIWLIKAIFTVGYFTSYAQVLMLTEPVDLLSHNCVTKSHKIKFDSISGCAKVAVHETLTTQHILSILSPDPIVISQPQPAAPSWSISNKG